MGYLCSVYKHIQAPTITDGQPTNIPFKNSYHHSHSPTIFLLLQPLLNPSCLHLITVRSHFLCWSTHAGIKPALDSGQHITNSSVTEAQQQYAAALPALIYLQSSASGTPVNPPSAGTLQLQKTTVMYNPLLHLLKAEGELSQNTDEALLVGVGD